jgi:hypothetical protein
VRDEADAAGVMFVMRAIKALLATGIHVCFATVALLK